MFCCYCEFDRWTTATDFIHSLTFPQSPAVHLGHGRRLQGCFVIGLLFSAHILLNRPLGNLQLVILWLMPSPHDTEHWKKRNKTSSEGTDSPTCSIKKNEDLLHTSPQGPIVHCGHGSILHCAVVSGLFLTSQLKSWSLHSTKRFLTPEPQLTEHCEVKQAQNSLPYITND